MPACCWTTAAPTCGWCSRTPRDPTPNPPASATTRSAPFSACPGVARAANVTYLTMQVRRGSTDVRAMVVGFEPGHAGRAGLPGRGPPHHAQPLRSGGRRADRLRAGRPHPHPAPRLHRGGPHPAHGLLGRRPDGLHPAQGRAGSAVPEGQRRDPERAGPHRRQPGLEPARRAGPAGSGAGFAGRQPQRERGAGAVASPGTTRSRWPSRSAAGSTCRPSPARRWNRSWWPS